MKIKNDGLLLFLVYLTSTSAFFIHTRAGFRTQRSVPRKDATLSSKQSEIKAVSELSSNTNADISTTVLVTGANGVLGRSFIRYLSKTVSYARIFASYRNMDKAVEAIEQAATDPTAISLSQIIPFIINMLDTNSTSADIQDIFEDKIMNNRLLLVNNAGVCLEGCTIEALKESLEVNCIGPAFLSELFLNYANIDRKESGNQISIINVSSGDGELVFLHSEIQRQINAIETYEEWTEYITKIIANFDPTFQYSHGSTPFYALSKALLNSYTRIKHTNLSNNCQIYSVCPGNVASPMSTEEELENTVHADEAVADITHIALNPSLYKSGLFYRSRLEIPW